jgi:cellulose biosynthesis protein BcsQ
MVRIKYQEAIGLEVKRGRPPAGLAPSKADLVFRTKIRVDVRLIEAPSFGKTIFQYDRRSSGAERYLQLAGEILKKGKVGP